MIEPEFLLYAGGSLLFIYFFVTACFFNLLWERVRANSLRDVLLKLAAALCWPYAVWRACRETMPELPPGPLGSDRIGVEPYPEEQEDQQR